MPGGIIAGAFAHSSSNIYTTAVAKFTSSNTTYIYTYKTFTHYEAIYVYCSSNHMILPEAIFK